MKCSHLPFEAGVPVPCRQTRKLSLAGDGTCCSLAAGMRAEMMRLCSLDSWSLLGQNEAYTKSAPESVHAW